MVRNANLDDAAAVAEVIRASEEAEGAPIDMAAEDIRSSRVAVIRAEEIGRPQLAEISETRVR